jgi:histidine triad (HIT) family protein
MCLFCKIVQREIPAKVVLESEHALAFEDLRPAAPTHVLVVPKRHIESLAAATASDAAVLGELFVMARQVAEKAGIAESGFRTVVNAGPHAGQSVDHLHVHVLGGRPMAWPPG